MAVILFHTTTSLSLFVVDFTYYWVLLVAAILIVMTFGAKDLVIHLNYRKEALQKSR